MPVVATGELDHLGPAGGAAGQPDRAHGRLGPRVDEADLVDRRNHPRDQFGKLHLGKGGGAEGGAPDDRRADGVQDLGVGMAEEQRTPRADIVDVGVAIDIGEAAPARGRDEEGLSSHGAERAHGRVDAAGDEPQSFLEHLGALSIPRAVCAHPRRLLFVGHVSSRLTGVKAHRPPFSQRATSRA